MPFQNIEPQPVKPVDITTPGEPIVKEGDADQQVLDYFGISSKELLDVDVKKQLADIVEYASIGAKDSFDILSNIKRMKIKIGCPYDGTHAIQKIFTYAKIALNRYKLDKQMQAYEVQQPTVQPEEIVS